LTIIQKNILVLNNTSLEISKNLKIAKKKNRNTTYDYKVKLINQNLTNIKNTHIDIQNQYNSLNFSFINDKKKIDYFFNKNNNYYDEINNSVIKKNLEIKKNKINQLNNEINELKNECLLKKKELNKNIQTKNSLIEDSKLFKINNDFY
jgi:hypothetical protein